jgi:hypothetical protein
VIAPLTATPVGDSGGTLLGGKASPHEGAAAAMEDLRQDLRAMAKKCRTDWDITTPELKEAWQQGRKELFCPYGKTYVQTPGEQV